MLVICCRRRQIGFYGWFPPQRRTEGEEPEPAAACGGYRQAERWKCKGALARLLHFPEMTNVELLSILLSIAGLAVGVFALALALKR